MPDLFCVMGCRLRERMKDSIMMNIMFLAMDKVHENLKSKQGVIGRLIEISKFYQLAVMQLDGCLRIVEEETRNLLPEVNYEELVSDLYVTRDRVQKRLDDTELTIMNTDSCLAERFENEFKLREALEMKEKELVSLQGELDLLERPKRKGHREIRNIRSNQASRVTISKEGDLNQLKNSRVNAKFYKINGLFEERNFNVESRRIDKLGSDIDRLKESLDRAFAKMQSAMLLSVEPAENEWRWSIEKDVLLVSAKGLAEEFQVMHEPTVRKLNHFLLLMNEVQSLHTELDNLMRENETSLNSASFQTDSRVKVPTGAKERPPLDGKKGKYDEHSKDDEADHNEEEGGNYVARLISTHERIIQKTIEERRAKERLIRERWYSAMRKDKQSDGLNKKIQDVIARLDSIIVNSNPQIDKASVDLNEDSLKPVTLRRFSSESEIEIRNLSSSIFCQVDEDLLGQVRILERDKEDTRLQLLIRQEVLVILLRTWIKRCSDEFNTRIKELFNKVRMMEQEAENSKTKSMILENACRKLESENIELYRNIKVLEQVNEDWKWQSHILEEMYAVLLTVFIEEHCEELQKLSASKDLLEEIVFEFTKML